MKGLIFIFFINLMFSANIFAASLEVDWSEMIKLPEMDQEEEKILNEIKTYINSENKNANDGINSLVNTEKPLKVKIVWLDPEKDSGILGDGNYDCPVSLAQHADLHLNEPFFNFESKHISKADSLNGYEWKGVLTIYTNAIKLELDKEEFLKNNKEIENFSCKMMIKGIDRYSRFQNFNFPSQFEGQYNSISYLQYNNIWIDYTYDQYIYYLVISKFKDNIFKDNLLIDSLKTCNIDNSSELCDILK